ncbi:P-loop NTPase fold protein [Crocosphaera sp. Alani8]|uniref:P-loop NTPase fold protein n=1 Tax=Crocosphaera sp. Alani8 TaxID=3038952 RepID=UPI00313E67AB
MQEIFFELNHQISLEKQLGKILSQTDSENTKNSKVSQNKETSSPLLIYRFIYNPWKKIKGWAIQAAKLINNYVIRPVIYFSLQCIRWVDLIIVSTLWHLAFFIVFVVTYIFLFLVYFGCQGIDKITSDRFDLENLFQNPISFLDFWGEEIRNYYFFIETSSQFNAIETIIENVLFFLFAGFPKRLQFRNRRWKGWLKRWSNEQKINPQNSNTPPSSNTQSDEYGEALRDGGKIWKCLYMMNEEERNALLRQELNKKTFEKFQKLTTDQQVSNYLWQTLDEVRTTETKQLQQAEQKLKDKEKELQRSLTNAEVEVNNKISRKANAAYWKPLVNIILRLKFNKKEIEKISASGKTLKNVPIAITSWSGLIALFLVCFLLVLSTQTEILNALIAQIKKIIENYEQLNTLVTEITEFIKNNKLLSSFIALIPAIKPYLDAVIQERKKVKSERESELKEERKKSDNLVKEVAQLKQQVAQKRQNIGITANYSSLMEFVTGRLENQSYGQHLGLMRQVQKDLEDLSRHLTVNDYNRETLKQLFPRGPARVIIYIDDLDRCPPDRVVEVLETVQLLLKTELFIVVLAIDDRYISRALEQVYTGVLKRKGKPSGLDYLEKIIQIPYRMRPISPENVENYLSSQVAVNKDKNTQQNQISEQSVKEKDTERDNDKLEISEPLSDKLDTTDESKSVPVNNTNDQENDNSVEEKDNDANKNNSKNEQDNNKQVDLKTQPKKSSENENFKYIQTSTETTDFDPTLLDILIKCCKPVDITPRTAKRLINITKILQIIWSKPKQDTTIEEKRIVIAFLALSGRYPNFMRYLFDEIDVLLEERTFYNNGQGEKLIENAQLKDINFETEILDKIKPQTAKNDYYFQREWRRFTNDLKRTLGEHFKQFSISRRAFSLIISFSFVSDLGYDPDDYSSENPLDETEKIETWKNLSVGQ